MKYRIPRFGPAALRTFNRDRFLDGTYPTYFAPGQDPGVVATYQNPTDWRPAGGILTPPQVVWLTACTIDAANDEYEQKLTNGVYNLGTVTKTTTEGSLNVTTTTTYFNDGGSFSIVMKVDPFQPNSAVTTFPTTSKYVFVLPGPNDSATVVARGDTTDPPTFDPSTAGLPGEAEWERSCLAQCTVAYDQSIPNLMAQQRERLLPLFQQVADAIAAIRPGKTWVRINDLSNVSPDFYDFAPCMSYSIAPDSTKGPFFGVDFLHLHALAFSIDGIPPFDIYEQGGIPPGSADDYDTQLRDAYRYFTRYACWLYGPDGQYAKFPDVPKIPFTPAPDLPGGGDTTVIDRINSARQSNIGGANNFYQGRNPGLNDVLQSEADNLKDCGVVYQGTQSDLSDVGTIVGLIAAHFGFDPDTGDDL